MSRFLKLPEVRSSTGLGTSSIYALVKDEKFPKPVKLGPRASAWIEDEVERWKLQRVKERDSQQA